MVARFIQSTLSQLQIHLNERNDCFDQMEIYLYEKRNPECLGRTRFERTNLTPVRIELFIGNHHNVDGVIATLIHEIGHMLLPYHHQHYLIWKETTGLLLSLVDDMLGRLRSSHISTRFQNV